MGKQAALSLALVAVVSAECLVSSPVRADDIARADEPRLMPAQADDVANADDARSTSTSTPRQIDRTWLYADDARVAAPMTVIGTSTVSYTRVGPSPSRIASPYPNVYDSFAANTAQPGEMAAFGGELGLLPALSLTATALVGVGGTNDVATPSLGAIAGLRLRVSPSDWQNTHFTLSAGYLRQAWSGPVYDDDAGKWLPGSRHGDDGAWLQAAFAQDAGKLRLATTVHGEHIFAQGRDSIDMMVELGASYRLVETLRLGVEYVGQDLEESFNPGAEGGARHFLGPVASMQFLDQRVALVAGPAMGLSRLSPSFVGRVGVSYAF